MSPFPTTHMSISWHCPCISNPMPSIETFMLEEQSMGPIDDRHKIPCRTPSSVALFCFSVPLMGWVYSCLGGIVLSHWLIPLLMCNESSTWCPRSLLFKFHKTSIWSFYAIYTRVFAFYFWSIAFFSFSHTYALRFSTIDVLALHHCIVLGFYHIFIRTIGIHSVSFICCFLCCFSHSFLEIHSNLAKLALLEPVGLDIGLEPVFCSWT